MDKGIECFQKNNNKKKLENLVEEKGHGKVVEMEKRCLLGSSART